MDKKCKREKEQVCSCGGVAIILMEHWLVKLDHQLPGPLLSRLPPA